MQYVYVTPASISDIKFVCPRSKKQCREESDQGVQLVQPHKEVVPPSAAAVASLFEEINMAEKSLPYSRSLSHMLRNLFLNELFLHYHALPMMELYNPATLHMDYLSLLKACESVLRPSQ